MKTYENTKHIATGQGDDYTTGCLLDYTYVKGSYEVIAIDLSKQQSFDADPKAIQHINFTGNGQVANLLKAFANNLSANKINRSLKNSVDG